MTSLAFLFIRDALVWLESDARNLYKLKKKGVYINWSIYFSVRYCERDSDVENEISLHCILTDWFLPLLDIERERETVILKNSVGDPWHFGADP